MSSQNQPVSGTYNIFWILNEELCRLHIKIDKSTTTSNANAYWNQVQSMHKIILSAIEKSSDPDVMKALAELQDHVADQIILGDK